MTKRRLDSYIDALADGRRPESFDADPEEIELLARGHLPSSSSFR